MDLFNDESDDDRFYADIFDFASAIEYNDRRKYSRINYYPSELSDSKFTFKFSLDSSSVTELLLKIILNFRVSSR